MKLLSHLHVISSILLSILKYPSESLSNDALTNHKKFALILLQIIFEILSISSKNTLLILIFNDERVVEIIL